MSNQKRLYLLSEAEIEEIYDRPIFNQEEQSLYFELNQNELNALDQLESIKTRLHFILQIGYFKAKQRFFKFRFEDVQNDVTYIVNHLSHLFDEPDTEIIGGIARNSVNIQKRIILKLFSIYFLYMIRASLKVI